MAESLVGPITEKLMEKLLDIGFNYLKDQVTWQTGMKEELERLQENQDKIRAVVSASIQAQNIDQNTEINNWIWRLRDAFDEADDVLDDFEYMKHKEQLATNMVRSTMSSLKKIGKRALKIDPILKRLEEVVHKLDKISSEVNNFRYLLKETQQEQKVQQDKLQNDRETGSMPKDVLIGRSQDKEFVIQWLGKLPNEEHQSHVLDIPNIYHNISLLSIVGHGGMGKTTLLQHVYKDKVTEEFDLKMWVCVSNNFDVKKVIIDMLESIQNSRPSLDTLDKLQENLKAAVESKKFLLVLDDIWEENEEGDRSKWENVLAPLAHGGLGSKILITTRMNSAASMIAKVIKKQNEPLLTVEGLKKDKCLQLLNTHAFAGVENPNDLVKLRSITEKLVKKLFGSPLAAKVIGGVLNSNLDERHWTNILNNVMGYNGMFPILKLSYIFLPKYLQNCFAFCSIFAQDHVFDEDDLVRMWIAVGFIQPSNIQGEDLEDIGRRYINILFKKSFFEKNKSGYKMHDLLHELAQSVSAQECFRIVGDEDSAFNIPKTIRHLFVKTTNPELFKKLGKFKNLRTLCISGVSYSQYFDDVLTKIFEETRSIRLLSIDAYGQEVKLKAIGCLKHLRYLKIKFPANFRLPRSVSNLFHLQFLICKNIFDIPRDINNLSNLRHTNLPLYKCHGIGKLKSLHELYFFVENKTGYRIVELKHMNDLHILAIRCLENVRDAEEACNAKLCDKKKLTYLSLEWISRSQNIADIERYARLLDNLQPHNNLKELKMENYMGVRSAIWMNNANLINNLERIALVGCMEWQSLPPFGQLPFLKHLRLLGMPKAVRFDNKYHGNGIHCLFPSLEVLYIEDLEALEDWFDAGVDCLFPCLTQLEVFNCPNLQELPYLPPKLRILSLNKIGWKTLNYCSSISKSILLETLVVYHCPNIAVIPLTSEIIGRPATIEIVDCPNLLSLGGHQEVETTENCSSTSNSILLQRLGVNQCPNITVFPQTSEIIGRPSTIKIVDCPNLLSLGGHQEVETTENGPNLILDKLDKNDPSVLQLEPLRSVTSIKELRIKHNNELVSFPFEAERWFLQVSSSLRHLYLSNLKSLQSLPSSLTSLSSLNELFLDRIPLLKSLPDLPPSLCSLQLWELDNLDCLLPCLSSLSSLTSISIHTVPLLRELPDLPPSLCSLYLQNLDKLDCLPSCLSSLSSLTSIKIDGVPRLRELPDLPPSLCRLELQNLNILDCLPSCLSSLSSLTSIVIHEVPLLRELPDLPPSLCRLELQNLNILDCLPSCLSSLSLTCIEIRNVPLLRELPDLPPSLKKVWITDCDPEFTVRYRW